MDLSISGEAEICTRFGMELRRISITWTEAITFRTNHKA